MNVYPGVKRQELEANHSSPFISKPKIVHGGMHPHYAFVAVTGTSLTTDTWNARIQGVPVL